MSAEPLVLHPDATPDAVPDDLLEVVKLFAGALSDVRFPDVDGATLHAAAETVRERARELETARRALATAERHLADATAQLREQALRGVAYARVYAADDDGLTTALDGLGLEHRARKPRKRRTRKPPVSEVAALPLAGPG
jgi:hypothetical protein